MNEEENTDVEYDEPSAAHALTSQIVKINLPGKSVSLCIYLFIYLITY